MQEHGLGEGGKYRNKGYIFQESSFIRPRICSSLSFGWICKVLLIAKTLIN